MRYHGIGTTSPHIRSTEDLMTDIVIAGALRTAIGKFGGTLAKIPAPDLGATVIRALLARSGVSRKR
jgi:acetyl-CoA acetyltransferase